MMPWPFNPLFPKPFAFPAFGSVEWLAVSHWKSFKGSVANIPEADKLRATSGRDWKHILGRILLERRYTAPGSWRNFQTCLPNPGRWVEALLDADDFWSDINGWALQQAEDECKNLYPEKAPFETYGCHGTQEDCVARCQRFHAYQQARYRYHEHLLEKYCERTQGKAATKNPETPQQVRATLIGWLSTQRGFAKHPLVAKITRRIPSNKTKTERLFFDKERSNQSERRWDRPDEIGWLILTWPVWNSFGWRWPQITYAVMRKFRVPEQFPVFDEKGNLEVTKGESDWRRIGRNLSHYNDAIEQQCRRAVAGRLEILPRPKGRATTWDTETIRLWDFVYRISL